MLDRTARYLISLTQQRNPHHHQWARQGLPSLLAAWPPPRQRNGSTKQVGSNPAKTVAAALPACSCANLLTYCPVLTEAADITAAKASGTGMQCASIWLMLVGVLTEML